MNPRTTIALHLLQAMLANPNTYISGAGEKPSPTELVASAFELADLVMEHDLGITEPIEPNEQKGDDL